jgi:hypothetical protein
LNATETAHCSLSVTKLIADNSHHCVAADLEGCTLELLQSAFLGNLVGIVPSYLAGCASDGLDDLVRTVYEFLSKHGYLGGTGSLLG